MSKPASEQSNSARESLQPALDKRKPAKRKPLLDLLVGFVFGVIAMALIVAMFFHWVHTDQTKARLVKAPLPVQTVPAKVMTLHEEIGADGIVLQNNTANLTAFISSRVLSVPVDLGDVVKAGDVLVQLDDSLFVSTLEQAKVFEDHAAKQLHRMEVLEQKGLGSAVEVENAKIQETTAQRAVVAAQVDLDNTKIKSPLPAVILSRNINPGETTALSQSVMQIGEVQQVLFAANVTEDKSGFVHLGMSAEVSTDAFPGVFFTGKVVKMDALVINTTRTYKAYIRVPNEDLRLKVGDTGYARLQSEVSGLAVPSSAVNDPVGDRASVFVVGPDHHAHIRLIRRGLIVQGMTEILDGLSEGERVVTVGQLELHDNDPVDENQSAPWNSK